MKINTSAWHYRFWTWTQKYDYISYSYRHVDINLCAYCQRILLSGLSVLALVITAAFVVATILYTVLYKALYQHPVGTLIVIAGILAFFGIGYLIYRFNSYISDRPPSLVRQWLSARKAGICPIIEFEDSDEHEKSKVAARLSDEQR